MITEKCSDCEREFLLVTPAQVQAWRKREGRCPTCGWNYLLSGMVGFVPRRIPTK